MKLYLLIEMYGGSYEGIIFYSTDYDKVEEEYKRNWAEILNSEPDDPNLGDLIEGYLANEYEYEFSIDTLEVPGWGPL